MKKTINNKILNYFLKKINKTIVIDFWSESCIPCKLFNDTINEIKKIFKKKIKFIKINIKWNYYLTEKFSVRNVPTIIVIKNKCIVSKKQGLLSKNYMKKFLNKII